MEGFGEFRVSGFRKDIYESSSSRFRSPVSTKYNRAPGSHPSVLMHRHTNMKNHWCIQETVPLSPMGLIPLLVLPDAQTPRLALRTVVRQAP